MSFSTVYLDTKFHPISFNDLLVIIMELEVLISGIVTSTSEIRTVINRSALEK